MENNTGNIQQFPSCFGNWIVQQNEDLKQLILTMKEDSNDNEKLHLIVETNVKHYEEYYEKRLVYAQSNTSSFFSPSWCSSFQNSYLWVAGCRPSLFLRLVYTLCGSNLELHLDDFLQGVKTENLGYLSAEQLGLVDELQRETIESEDDISSKVASMQEQMADNLLVQLASSYGEQRTDSDPGVSEILGSLELEWVNMLEKADNLRLHTLKEIVKILTPLQVVEFLIAGKKLHLSLHQWCKKERS